MATYLPSTQMRYVPPTVKKKRLEVIGALIKKEKKQTLSNVSYDHDHNILTVYGN